MSARVKEHVLKVLAVALIVAIICTIVPIMQVSAETNYVGENDISLVTSNSTAAIPNYTVILNHSIVVANVILSRWGVPSNSTAWEYLRNATALLPKINEALLANNVTLARKLFIEGMKLVAQAIKIGAKESKNLKKYVRERLVIMRRTRECLAIGRALELSAKALNRTAYKLMLSGKINSTIYNEIKENITTVLSKLKELRNYLISVLNGTKEFNATYVKEILGYARKELGYIKSIIERIIVSRLMEQVKLRIMHVLRFMQLKVENITRIAEELREKGLNVTAAELERIALQLKERIKTLEKLMNSSSRIAVLARIAKEVMLRERLILAMNKLAELKHVEATPIISIRVKIVKTIRLLRNYERELNEIISKYGSQLPSDAMNDMKIAKEIIHEAIMKLARTSTVVNTDIVVTVLNKVAKDLNNAINKLNNACNSMKSNMGGKKGKANIQSLMNKINEITKNLSKLVNGIKETIVEMKKIKSRASKAKVMNMVSMLKITERIMYRIAKEVRASNINETVKKELGKVIFQCIKDIKKVRMALLLGNAQLLKRSIESLHREIDILVKITKENDITSIKLDIKILNNIMEHIVKIIHEIIHK